MVEHASVVSPAPQVYRRDADPSHVPPGTLGTSAVPSVQPTSGFELQAQQQMGVCIVPIQCGYPSMYVSSFWYPWSHPALWQKLMSSQVWGVGGTRVVSSGRPHWRCWNKCCV